MGVTDTGVTVAVHGGWESAIDATAVTAFTAAIADLTVADGRPCWTETLPGEGGRAAVMTTDGAGGVKRLSEAGRHVRSRVHEYGGTPFLPLGGWLLYSDYADQRLHCGRPGGAAVPLTAPGHRYADGAAAPDGRSVYYVREDHTGPGEPRNAIVRLDLDLDGPEAPRLLRETVIHGGSDFVAYPRPSPDGRHLAFIAWDHPHRPWDATRLMLATLGEGASGDVTPVPGPDDESVLEPRWDADGTLYCVSDRSGWWNLHRVDADGLVPVAPVRAELTGPLWTLGVASYALTGDGRAVAALTRDAVDDLHVIDLADGTVTPLDLPFVSITGVHMLNPGTAVAIARPVDGEVRVIAVDLATGAWSTLHAPGTLALDPASLSRPDSVWFPTAPGPDGEALHSQAFFYPPRNPRFQGPPGAKPPAIVMLHGGPTSHSGPALSLGRQFWTSRGFAVVDVNYGGSTGFGRAYRRRLRGGWGVVDLADVVAAVDHLVAAGRIDPDRVAIRGGSAGGYLVLAALAFSDRFKAGTNYYGVADIELLLRETHKFESRYGDWLVGPLPESREICRARSPVHHLDRFTAPLLTLQGLDDRIVPPGQSEAIVAALRARGVPVAYLPFAGEQHGFRNPATIVAALEAELSFYGQVFGFTPAGDVPPLRIEGLPARDP